MGHVEVSFGRACQGDVAFHDVRLGGVRHAMQAQAKRRCAQVHRTVGGHARVLSMLHNGDLELGGSTQRITHQAIIQNRLAVVGHRDRASFLQCGKIGELFSQAADGRGRNRKHIDQSTALRGLHPARDLRRIIYRHGVRHGADGAESASRGRRGSGGNGLFVGLSGLAQMHVQINETRSDDAPLHVEALLGLTAKLARRLYGSHAAVAQENVHLLVDAARRIDDPSVYDEQ